MVTIHSELERVLRHGLTVVVGVFDLGSPRRGDCDTHDRSRPPGHQSGSGTSLYFARRRVSHCRVGFAHRPRGAEARVGGQSPPYKKVSSSPAQSIVSHNKACASRLRTDRGETLTRSVSEEHRLRPSLTLRVGVRTDRGETLTRSVSEEHRLRPSLTLRVGVRTDRGKHKACASRLSRLAITPRTHFPPRVSDCAAPVSAGRLKSTCVGWASPTGHSMSGGRSPPYKTGTLIPGGRLSMGPALAGRAPACPSHSRSEPDDHPGEHRTRPDHRDRALLQSAVGTGLAGQVLACRARDPYARLTDSPRRFRPESSAWRRFRNTCFAIAALPRLPLTKRCSTRSRPEAEAAAEARELTQSVTIPL